MISKFKTTSALLLCNLYFIPMLKAETVNGIRLWKEKCLSCHATISEVVITEAFYASIQWDRFIKQDRHPKKIKVVLSEDEKRQILEYVKTKSADSDSPAVAGIR